MTKFTIILLCRNRPEYTEFALKSILRQKIKDYYVVLSDNSSTDNCAEKNRSSYEKYGNLFNGIYIRQSGDLTMCAHLTKILSQYSQSSDYIAIHNDDDIWLSSHLASAAIALDQGYSVFVGNAAEIDVNGKIISKYLSAPNYSPPENGGPAFRFWLKSAFGAFPSFVMSAQIAKSLPPIENQLVDVWIALWAIAHGHSVKCSVKRTFLYRRHLSQITFTGPNVLTDRHKFRIWMAKTNFLLFTRVDTTFPLRVVKSWAWLILNSFKTSLLKF